MKHVRGYDYVPFINIPSFGSGERTSLISNLDQTLYAQGAYTASNNAPAW